MLCIPVNVSVLYIGLLTAIIACYHIVAMCCIGSYIDQFITS